jgi:hypothetical protein
MQVVFTVILRKGIGLSVQLEAPTSNPIRDAPGDTTKVASTCHVLRKRLEAEHHIA